MDKKVFETIKQSLKCDIIEAEDNIKMYTDENRTADIDYWTTRKDELLRARNFLDEQQRQETNDQPTLHQMIYDVQDDETAKLIGQAEAIKQVLQYCSVLPGADITITVKHHHGYTATAELYDHAALVQGLYAAVEYFQSEI